MKENIEREESTGGRKKKKKKEEQTEQLEGQRGGPDVFEAKDKSLKQSVNPTLKMLFVFGYQEAISDLYRSSFTVTVRPEANLLRLGS